MKKLTFGAALFGVFFVISIHSLFFSVSGEVMDKRAPGDLGKKTYQVQVDDPYLIGPDEVWVTVSEHEWDCCPLGAVYPCGG